MQQPIPLDASFSRYGSNPVIVNGAGGSWESIDVTGEHVFYDVPGARWGLAYSGWNGTIWQQGLAYSTDLLTWTKDPANPVLSPNAGEYGLAANASIIYVAGLYRMIYLAATAGYPYTFCLATSPDLHTWTRQNGGASVFPLGSAGTFDAYNTFDQEVQLMADGSTLEMLYGAQSASSTATRSIGRAVSTDNGLTWTGRQKLFGASDVGSGIVDLTAPTFWRDQNGMHVMFQASTDGASYKLGHAISTDLAHWSIKWLVFNPTSGFESVSVSNPSVVRTGSKLFLVYSGANQPGGASNLNDRVAVATLDGTTPAGPGI